MNRERMLETAAALDIAGEDYDQSKWAHRCQTPGCIAGQMAVLAGGRFDPFGMDNIDMANVRMPDGKPRKCESVAQEWAELTDDQARRLFVSFPLEYHDHGPPTSAEAAATCRRAAETGKIEWVVLPEQERRVE